MPLKPRLVYGLRERSKRLYNLQWQANTTNFGPLWYYLSLMTNNTPKVTNSTALNGMYQDPWVLAEFKGRPVMTISTSAGPLF